MTVAPPRPIRLLSTRKVLHPARAASIAAYMPAPPDPMIRTSVSTCMGSARVAVMSGIIAVAPRFDTNRHCRGEHAGMTGGDGRNSEARDNDCGQAAATGVSRDDPA